MYRCRERPGAGGVLAVLWMVLFACCLCSSARAAFDDPLYVFMPEPRPPAPGPPPPAEPPPTGYLNGPCGVAVGPAGRVYVSDHYHDVVDLFSSELNVSEPWNSYAGQLRDPNPLGGPCGLSFDSAGNLYVNRHHRGVAKFGPSPGFAPGPVLDVQATGVAVDTATDRLYVNERTHVAVYESSGDPVLDGEGDAVTIGDGALAAGYGVAVSQFAGTLGRVYVADAADDTVKVFDPAVDPDSPVATLDGSATPQGGFVSLRDSSLAVDDDSGDVYVVDNLQPAHAEQPEAIVSVFAPTGDFRGHLKYKVVHGAPVGLAVDNWGGPQQGRVYVTSGNTHPGGLYVYLPGSATVSDARAPTIPPQPLGGGKGNPLIEIGEAAGGDRLCEGDACQFLPSPPVDPTLTTLLPGLGNPRVRYRRVARTCRGKARRARRAVRRARSAPRPRRAALRRHARRAVRRARRCRREGHAPSRRSRAQASVGSAVGGDRSVPPHAASAAEVPSSPGESPTNRESTTTAALAPIAPGFEVGVWGQEGEPAGLAGSHPYSTELTIGLDQGGGVRSLRSLAIELPPGLLANPAALSLCSENAFEMPRASPFEPSQSGESCPDRSQVGTVEVESGIGGGQARRFGLFNLVPPRGVAARFGASPFGVSLYLDARLRRVRDGSYALTLRASELAQSLQARGLRFGLWGVPWDASHDGERGNCLNQAEPSFPWAKCSVGEPAQNKPLAFLTLPTECGDPPRFAVMADAWEQADALSAQAVNRDDEGNPVAIDGCESIGFSSFGLDARGFLNTRKASSSSGFVFQLDNDDPGLTDPRDRIRSLPRRALVDLPDGVTLNPSLGAGLEGCEPGEYADESAFNAHGRGCPNGAKIGELAVRTPFYAGLLRGALYLAAPRRNPFGSLIAVYLVAKSADRGILIKAEGRLVPDQRDGTLSALFDDLPQLPYTDLDLTARASQRAPLVSPPRCGAARTRIELTPWAGAGKAIVKTSDTQIESGIDAGPCPDGSVQPFRPRVTAGGVNANVGSYTPYFVHLTRRDTEQEITSYSMVLPRGIVGKLAGIPFCPETAIAAARARRGFAERSSPSCPAASRVGSTLTGYGVGPALTYAPGHVYLAGPHAGRPLSLVTINAATVGPFDLGTIVVRSAFSVDPRTAQLAIDSTASDPIPHILEGIPLHLREVRVHMDRPRFVRNPTGCEAARLVSTVTGSGARFDDASDDSVVTGAAHFQLLNCLTLGFRPRLGLRLLGAARRGAHPGLRAVFRPRAGDASLKRIAVTMPRSLFLAQNHIREVCTRARFAAEACPSGSIYGRAVAHTPLFDQPLRGPVYLRSSEGKLPDLVASLRSGSVHIVLEGRIGPSKGGGIRAFFDDIPDAPIDRFAMWLRGGRRGLLVNSVNVCAERPRASVKALAQNNRGAIFTSVLRGRCGKQRSGKDKARRRGKESGAGAAGARPSAADLGA